MGTGSHPVLLVCPHFPCHSITQLHFDARTSQDVNPEPLRIAEPIILRLDFGEHDFLPLRVPQEKVWNTAASLLILLCHYLADC